METLSTPRPGELPPHAEPLYSTEFQYTDRATKARYIALKYEAILRGSVLDVGCDRAPLRALVARPEDYVGVDIMPGSDVVLDLDRQNLPFEACRFDTVVCTDVLEHLERCHTVADELFRVARDRVIISLPNPLGNLMWALLRGDGGRLKFYGLPSRPPVDRHRWFFGAEEADAFVRDRGIANGFVIEQLDHEPGKAPRWVTPDGKTPLDHPNIRRGTLWCVLRRADGTC